MKEVLFRLANLLGVDRWLRHRNRNRLLLLMYHGVVEEALDPFCWHQLPLPAFRRQMAWLRRHFVVLPLEQALELQARGGLPEHACAITFDDGYENVFDVAAPVLEAERLPASVFLVTSLVGTARIPWPDRVWLAFRESSAARVDLSCLGLGVLGLETRARRTVTLHAVLAALKDKPAVEKDALVERLERSLGVDPASTPREFRMTRWEDVAAAAAGGFFTFGAHSRTHEILSRVGDAEVESQVAGSQEDLTRRLGREAKVFAYPNGRAEDFDERSRKAVENAGIPWALTTIPGLAGADDDPRALPRISVGADVSFARFRLLCSGWS